MTIDVHIAADSVHPKSDSPRLTTMLLKYPRMVHSEMMTHRVFSRNASSSRAIPVRKMTDTVRYEIAYPVEWGKNQPGMQAHELLEDSKEQQARETWRLAAFSVLTCAETMIDLGVHKQIVNRMLEPFSHISVIVTATDWQNFFDLRCHSDADPTIRALADAMREAYETSKPVETMFHVPLVPEFNKEKPLRPYMMMSAARAARVSYLNHDNSQPDKERDLELATRLRDGRHMSPFEHQAIAVRTTDRRLTRNFSSGWVQHRAMVEME